MNPLKSFCARLRSLGQRRAVKREIDEELRFHLEQRTTENLAAGMSPEDAAREARKRFGNVQSVREECRETKGASFGEATLHDVRFGLRTLRKNPGFTVVAVLTLALGIGLNTAIFSVVYAVLWRPLPWTKPDRVVVFWDSNMQAGYPKIGFSSAGIQAWRKQSKSFQDIGAVRADFANLTGAEQPRRVLTALVTPNLFELFGVHPVLGRPLVADASHYDGVFIGERLWRREFGGDPGVVGRAVRLNGTTQPVLGVIPSTFELPHPDTEIWQPIAFSQLSDSNWGWHGWIAFGRLKDGVTLAAARSEMEVVSRRVVQAEPTRANWKVQLERISDFIYGFAGRPLLLLEASVAAVLLICCVNVANLLLVRAISRKKEMAIRGALGAGRLRLVRQLLVESLLLAGAGGAAGVAFAYWMLGAINSVLSGSGFSIVNGLQLNGWPRMFQFRFDPQVLAFTGVATLVTVLLFGLVPALRASQLDFNSALKESGAATARDVRGLSPGNLLVISEVSVCVVLLVCAGMMLRGFLNMRSAELGFDPRGVLTLDTLLPDSKYANAEAREQFVRQLWDAVGAIPGVASAAVADELPFSGYSANYAVSVEGRPNPNTGDTTGAIYRQTSPGYFKTMHVRVIEGRAFTMQDNRTAQQVVIINDAMRRQYFPNEKPVGRRISISDGGANPATIIGVVADERFSKLGGAGEAAVYRPLFQHVNERTIALAVRGAGNPEALADSLRKAVWSLDPSLPLERVVPMSQRVGANLMIPRFGSELLGLFAGGGLLLAALGLYGVLAHAVARRTRELGIRLALGAEKRNVLWLVIRDGMKLTLTGVGVGIVVALMVTRSMTGLLYGVKPGDPLTLGIVSLVLTLVAFLACWLPARRAARINPMEALRCE
jgi:putative ABC transport system permease protein